MGNCPPTIYLLATTSLTVNRIELESPTSRARLTNTAEKSKNNILQEKNLTKVGYWIASHNVKMCVYRKQFTKLQSITWHMISQNVTCHTHRWTFPTLTPARQAGTRLTYPRGMEGWVYLGDAWLYNEMVYLLLAVTDLVIRTSSGVWSA